VNLDRLGRVEPGYHWPDNYAALRRGEGCPMCEGDGDETARGERVFKGRWADGYLGRYPLRPGYSYVIWNGRHVAEPSELSRDEAAGFWTDVALVAAAIEECYRPAKMNWFHLGNGVPHLHVHLVPRPHDDARAGIPLESEAFDLSVRPPIDVARLEAEATVLRDRLGR
jgi:diadenosine tetraphosphate (Ap4A) HIT family hydrolase